MGRAACCRDHEGQRRGPWTPEEDQKLIHYLQRHGLSNWRTLPKLAGLSRCGKSCRLRWTNYLRPDIKHGTFTIHEDLTVIHLHAILGNKWSAIASHLPGRTDNEIKNRWNTKLKKQLLLMGIDPVTHRSLPTPDYTYSFVASPLTVKSSIAAGCNTALVESELGRLARDYVNNIAHVSPGSWQPSEKLNLSGTIKSTVEPPVWAYLPGARTSCENSLPLPSISMDELLQPRTSRWLHGFQNEINQGFDSRQIDPIEYNAFSQEALQFSNLERKPEGMADMISNLKNKTVVFPDGLASDEESKYDESRHSYKGGISEILENSIQYHRDDPFGSPIITADLPAPRANLLNKGDEINYWYNLLNAMENGMPDSN